MADAEREKEALLGGEQPTGKNVDSDLEVHLAIACYLATYVDGNITTKEYYNQLADNHKGVFYAFLKEILDDDSRFDLKFKEEMESSLENYKAAMKRIVNGDTRLQTKMLSIRKFFSCPWLVCPDQLIRDIQ